MWELWRVYPIRWGQCAVPGFDSAQLSQVTLGTITLASKHWRNHISFVCMERVWRGHSTSSCVRHVASTVAMWQRLWRPMTWCPGSSSHMPHRLSSILAHRSLRCLLAFSWRWKRTALRASMIPWSNARWSPNQVLCFNTPTRIATLIATHASIFTNWMIYIMYWYVKSPNFLARNNIQPDIYLWEPNFFSNKIPWKSQGWRHWCGHLQRPRQWLLHPRHQRPQQRPGADAAELQRDGQVCGPGRRQAQGILRHVPGTLDIWDGDWGRERAGCLGI